MLKIEPYRPHNPSRLEPHVAQIAALLRHGWPYAAIARKLADECEVTISSGALRDFCHRRGIVPANRKRERTDQHEPIHNHASDMNDQSNGSEPQLPKRAVFTQGGKGGVGKTEVALALASWYRANGIEPALLDFDIENSNNSGFQSFFPEATKLDVHEHGSLDAFFSAFYSGAKVVLADLAGGASNAAQSWFEEAAEYASEMGVAFTAVGVTTNDAGSIQSILKWAGHLQHAVDYLVVLNEMRNPKCDFRYWHDDPNVAEFIKILEPTAITMRARLEEFQAEVRNHACTLEAIIAGEVDAKFFRYTRNIVRAKIYQRQLYEGFDKAAAMLLPSPHLETAELPLD